MASERAATLNVRPETIADLKGHPQNYQRHPESQIAELIRSIRRHGAYKNAVISADGYILAGHGILEAARQEGWKQWPCERRDYNHDHPDALNLLLTDNEVGNPANPLGPDPDAALLAALAQQVNEATGLEGTGLDEARLAELLAVQSLWDTIPDEIPDLDGYEKPELALRIIVQFDDRQDRDAFLGFVGASLSTEAVRLNWRDTKAANAEVV